MIREELIKRIHAMIMRERILDAVRTNNRDLLTKVYEAFVVVTGYPGGCEHFDSDKVFITEHTSDEEIIQVHTHVFGESDNASVQLTPVQRTLLEAFEATNVATIVDLSDGAMCFYNGYPIDIMHIRDNVTASDGGATPLPSTVNYIRPYEVYNSDEGEVVSYEAIP